MRVLLVSANVESRPYPVAPVGLSLVASALSRAGHRVRVVDRTAGATTTRLDEVLREEAPELIGVGVRNVDDLTMGTERSYVQQIEDEIIRPLLSGRRPGVPLVLGGAGLSLYAEELRLRFGADYAVLGEGEVAMVDLAHALSQGEAPPTGVLSSPPLSEQDLRAPSRLHEWIDLAPYRERGSYPVQTRRGCPRGCVYCTYPAIEGRHHRLRSPQAVVDEIEEAQGGGAAGMTFEFVDSNFNDPPTHARAICQEIIERGLEVRLRAMGINPRGTTEELVTLMRRAGFAQIDCTPDSASPSMLSRLGKGFGRGALDAVARAVRAAAMPTMWFFLLGGPGETEDTVAETLDFIDSEVDPDDMVYLGAGLRIYPRTPLYHTALDERVIGAEESLLAPRFYVSSALTPAGLTTMVERACESRANCVPAWRTAPPPEMLQRAAELRRAQATDEPMFRTLIRVRRAELEGPATPRG